VPTTGQDDSGFAILAGCSADASEVRVLISNYQIPAEDLGSLSSLDYTIPNVTTITLLQRQTITYADNSGYSIRVAGLPWGSAASTVKRYRIDASNNLALIDTSSHTGAAVRVTAALAAQSVELLVITKA
jgi:hypothetical protein